MPQVRMKKVAEDSVIKHYVRLKNLLLSEQQDAAVRYFRDQNLIGNWRDLYKFTGTRKNCRVITLIIDMVYQFGNYSEEEFLLEISKATHGIHYDFSQRIRHYLKSGNFDQKLEKYEELNNAVADAVFSKGLNFVNLKPDHFEAS